MTPDEPAPEALRLELDRERHAAELSVLAIRALPHFGLDPSTCHASLARFGENAVFRVDGVGQSFALRIHRDGYNSDVAIRSELAWVHALRSAGVPTPEPIAGRDGEFLQHVAGSDIAQPRRCVMFRWIDGEPAANATDIVPAFQLLGNRIALIHRHGRRWDRPPWFMRHRWDIDGTMGAKPIWGAATDLDRLTPSETSLLREASVVIRRHLETFGTADDRFGLIHADPNMTNVFVEAGAPVVLDFDDCGFGWRLYDLATALYEYLGDPPLFRRLENALLEGYTSVEALPADHRSLLPVFYALRILVILGWQASHAETPHAQSRRDARVALAVGFLPDFVREWSRR